MAKFKQEVLESIKSDPDLYSLVAKTMKIMPTAMPSTLKRNGSTLNDYSVIKAVAEYLKKEPEDLLEELSEAKA